MACDLYTLDMAAAKFGACKCGYTKPEHVVGGGVAHEEAWIKAHPELAPPPSPVVSKPPEIEYEPHACDNFALDPLASFGTCTCGWRKADHGKPKVVKGSLDVAAAAESASPRAGTKSAAPCLSYKLNISATTFGECTCGWKKEEHQSRAF